MYYSQTFAWQAVLGMGLDIIHGQEEEMKHVEDMKEELGIEIVVL